MNEWLCFGELRFMILAASGRGDWRSFRLLRFVPPRVGEKVFTEPSSFDAPRTREQRFPTALLIPKQSETVIGNSVREDHKALGILKTEAELGWEGLFTECPELRPERWIGNGPTRLRETTVGLSVSVSNTEADSPSHLRREMSEARLDSSFSGSQTRESHEDHFVPRIGVEKAWNWSVCVIQKFADRLAAAYEVIDKDESSVQCFQPNELRRAQPCDVQIRLGLETATILEVVHHARAALSSRLPLAKDNPLPLPNPRTHHKLIEQVPVLLLREVVTVCYVPNQIKGDWL
jgi:hypothetical protein